MVYAIIQTGGKQYKVQPGEVLQVEKLSGNPGDMYRFEQVLLVKDDDGKMRIGTPFLEDVVVEGEILRHFRGKKIIVHKRKPKKNYERTYGHRQELTEVKIKGIKVT